MSASIEQIWNIVAKICFLSYFHIFSPICSNNCGVVFFRKYILVFEKWLFSFDRLNMQIFTVNITRVVWPHVTNVLDLRYFCEHNPLFYHLNLIIVFFEAAKEIFIFWWIVLSDILFLCRPPGPNPLADMDPPSADLDPPTKLNENIILNVLVKMDDTLRSNAY